MKNTKIYNWTISQALVMIIALVAIMGAGVYKLYALNWWGVAITLILVLAAVMMIGRHSVIEKLDWKIKSKDYWSELLYLLLWSLAVYLLWQARSGEAIVSAWQTINPWFFLIFAALSISVLYLAARASRYWSLATILYLSVAYGVAVIVYKVGYGFDPFIHQATIKFINEFGAVAPKPLYYAGQYALEVITHKLSGIDLATLDKLLVPLLAAVLVPLTLWQSFKKVFQQQTAARIVIVLIATLVSSLFLITTPQNLAYLFLIILLAESMSASSQNWLLNYSLALAALVTQPVAGIPALLAVAGLQLYTSALPYRKIFVGASLGLLALLLPMSFFLIDKSYNLAGHLSFNRFNFGIGILTLPNEATPWLNFAYGLGALAPLAILILVLAGYVFNRRMRAQHDNHYDLYLWQSLAMIIAYLLTKTISFSFLIDYERDNYADRMLVCALIFALPLLAIGLYELVVVILKTEKWQKVTWTLAAAAALTATLYLAYPRYDQYINSHSYATSDHDMEAVKWINDDAGGKDYIVLANQQVSAAALRQFGFAKYYSNDIFYYPVPTGGLLYQYYLALVKEPNLATIKTAGELVGVKRVYVVIDDYWWQSKRLVPELALMASEHKVIAGGKVEVFEFTWK